MELEYCGSTISAASKPAPFVCLLLKLLQIQPDKEIAIAYIQQSDFKYVRALGAMYMRLVASPPDVYQYVEPLLGDWRKLRVRSTSGWAIVHMDEFADQLLVDSSVFGIALPYLPKRAALEKAGKLQPRESLLQTTTAAQETTKYQPCAPASVQGGSSEVSLTVEASNKLRADLGLAPLR